MGLNVDRVQRAQALMEKEGIDALLLLTHDDYLYFFGEDRFQPRAVIPRQGLPTVITFRSEVDEARQTLGVEQVRVFSTVGQQIHDVITILRDVEPSGGAKLTVGAQLSWFEVPVSLMTLFQRSNPQVSVVDSAPVMDELRFVKDPSELERMRGAAECAALGMRAALGAIREGVSENEVAAEAEYALRKAGASGTATPIFVNSGEHSLWLHGTASERRLGKGDLIVLDLVPRYRGYLANLARTAVLGEPSREQRALFDGYAAAQRAAIEVVRPGIRISEMDGAAQAEAARHGFEGAYIPGISHGIGLRFEETPAPTIHPKQASFILREGMTITAGHSVLAVPGVGGVRMEDTGRVGPAGWEPITDFPRELFEVG